MQPEELIRLVERIRRFKSEFQTVEIKTAAGGCPKLYDTLSSFSNQDAGGTIVFGLREKNKMTGFADFSVVGVYDVQDIQQKIAAQCKEMEPEIRPLISVAEINGKFVVAVEVPAVDVAERPVFYKGAGRLRGSYVRVGDADEPMNEYEIYTYDAFRRRTRDDLRVVEGAKISLLQESMLRRYIDTIKEESANLKEAADNEILELMGVTADGVPTLAGVLVFGKYPQAYFPQLSVTAVVVPGLEMGDTGMEGERFIANKRLNGTISDMLQGAVEFATRNIRTKTIIDENGRRQDKPEFPMKAVREVILNALVHRDYSLHTEGSPVTICMFSDRLEVTNKGGLYGRVTTDLLGKVHPETRNPALANMLEMLGETENRYSGIPTIRREMADAGLPEPEFTVQRGEFRVTLRNNLMQGNAIHTAESKEGVQIVSDGDGTALGWRVWGYAQGAPTAMPQYAENTPEQQDNESKLLDFCKVPRTRDEIVAFMGFSRYYTMSRIVKPLVEAGRLKMSIPDKPKSRGQRYYVPERI